MFTEVLHELELAKQNFEFAVRMLSYCEQGFIRPDDFDTPHVTQLPNGSLRFPSGNYSDQDSICRAASVSVVVAFGAAVLVLDQAFELFGTKPDGRSTDNIIRLRTLVYMIRCAYAHRTADPRWEVHPKNRQTLIVALPSQTISLDLATLNQAAFDIDCIGGYIGWFEMHALAREHFRKRYE
ncbi:hypothetical protein [Bradyrhizobium sp. MOS003]|uniref:hypothetical protein n=1 Tax=Bradyrhizobium sp. MOS003 TaxID=2133946 RepID=UPI0011BF7923|nr:hypothetical protein [Bradyrhizobium sp. MOS003]